MVEEKHTGHGGRQPAGGIQSPRIADAIADHLKRLILDGVLRPGEKLAPERELSERFDVSRPSLRAAVERLAREGLLDTGRRGTFVAGFLKPLSDPLAAIFAENNQDHRVTLDFYEFRRPLDIEAAVLAAERATEVDRDAIRACIATMTEAHEKEDPSEEANADVDLHMIIYEAAHNVVLMHVMRTFFDMFRKGIFFARDQFYRRPGVRETLFAQHLEIAGAVLAGDAEAARKAAAEHVRFHIEAFRQIRDEERRLKAALERLGRRELLSGQAGPAPAAARRPGRGD